MERNKFRTVGIILGACCLYAMSAGLRSVYGIMLSGISEMTGIAYGAVSFSIAVGQLAFGMAQPVFGILALKTTKRFVLMMGSFLMTFGVGLIPFCKEPWMLTMAMGVVLAVGTGAVSFGMIMGAVTPLLGEQKAVAVTGLVNASSGVGSVLLSPLLQRGFEVIGVRHTLFVLAILTLFLVPVSMFVSRKENKAVEETEKTEILPILINAFRNRSYWCLIVGFFTCGFHMATIETHLFSQIVSYGISEAVTAIFFSIYGFATILGSLMSGFLCERIPMKVVVGALYASRVVWVGAFLILPKNQISILIIMVLLGMTGASTLTPTSGLTSKIFGSENLATLFGVIFLSHQVGSFFSAWIGGKCVEIIGNYVLVWILGMLFSSVAAFVSFSICEEKDNF